MLSVEYMQTSASESIPITILTLPELHLGQKQTRYPNFNIVGEIWMQKHKWRIGKRQ
jgi:hypothetical protein